MSTMYDKYFVQMGKKKVLHLWLEDMNRKCALADIIVIFKLKHITGTHIG